MTLVSCTKKYNCVVLPVKQKSLSKYTEVLRFERDTCLGAFTGKMYRSEKGNENVSLIFGDVLAINVNSKIALSVQTDLDGNFHLYVKPSTYNLEFLYTGYNSIILKNVVINAGEKIYLEVVTSEGRVDTNFETQPDGTFKKYNP